jgi:PEP-CTERM motif
MISLNGTYSYTYRFSIDAGSNLTAADLDGAGSNAGLTFDPSNLGLLTVTDGIVPEPSTGLLVIAGLLGVASWRRRA